MNRPLQLALNCPSQKKTHLDVGVGSFQTFDQIDLVDGVALAAVDDKHVCAGLVKGSRALHVRGPSKRNQHVVFCTVYMFCRTYRNPDCEAAVRRPSLTRRLVLWLH